METTYSNLFNEIIPAIQQISVEPQDKTSYAVKKVAKSIQSCMTEYQEKIQDIDIDNCSTDEKGIILTDEKGSYKFTKDGMKNRIASVKTLNKETVSISAHIITEIREGISSELQEVLKGLLF